MDTIKHFGVKGMRWGVRRDRNRRGGSDGKLDQKDKIPNGALGKRLNSLKRERQWKTVLSKIDDLSNKDIKAVTNRVTLENSLKTLSKSKVGNKKDREDYFRRERMSDEELSRKVNRLRAKEALHKAVMDASKEQREFGHKVAQIGGTLSVKYALNKSVTEKDIIEAVNNPKSASKKAREDLLNAMLDKTKKSKT